MRIAICTVFVICGLAAPAGAQQTQPAAIPVGVVKAEHRPIEKTLDFVGRVDAVNRVEIRARVQGFLEAVLFKEGDPIREGAPLYRIEKGLFQAAVEQAEGQILADEASLQTAKINLGYTEIVAPISGRIGRTNITKGNVVGPDSGTLTVIVSQDPMYVTFPVSQREFLRAQEAGHQVDIRNIKVRLRFADGSIYKEQGQINFVDVTVNR